MEETAIIFWNKRQLLKKRRFYGPPVQECPLPAGHDIQEREQGCQRINLEDLLDNPLRAPVGRHRVTHKRNFHRCDHHMACQISVQLGLYCRPSHPIPSADENYPRIATGRVAICLQETAPQHWDRCALPVRVSQRRFRLLLPREVIRIFPTAHVVAAVECASPKQWKLTNACSNDACQSGELSSAGTGACGD